jgi:hypothetical protein
VRPTRSSRTGFQHARGIDGVGDRGNATPGTARKLSGERAQQSGLFSGLSFTALRRATGWVPNTELSATETESTLFRFFRSTHVRDLKLIGAAALVVFLSHLAAVLMFGVVDALNLFIFGPDMPELVPWGNKLLARPNGPGLWQKTFATGSEFISFAFKYIGPTIPIYGLILGWAYQSASKRLGIVDLFACEIGTLCRVGTIFDIGNRYVERYNKPPSENGGTQNGLASQAFVSKEEYFPVFQSNSRDLQLLEASVVNDITQFHTYMKALRDAHRRLAETKPQPVNALDEQKSNLQPESDPWHTVMISVIHLTFLSYESARKAISNLVEYQPARAERLIVILLTELKCFSFLRQHFKPDDLRWQRLQLREADYKEQVLDLYDEVVVSPHGQNAKDWLQAQTTIPELESRYQEALGEGLATTSEKRRANFKRRK